MTFNFDLTVTLGVIVTVVLAFIGWFRMRHAAIDKRIDDCNDRLDRQEVRLGSVQQTLQTMPGKDEMHGLSMSISEMRGEMREMRAVMEGNNRIMERLETIVTRHEDHLLKR
ncbi:DUF2730 family protein [Paracoccus onubensis]|uniref:DUF2730 family protein n=1 Tax=Paracoccus onubensis TaxID=1675788 RepID=A0A418T1U2_9RHOB|nr:DUF2730 family protein [Paracoccus onubensis]RJE87123.1 DUF2730 family protein [Paracoccus onubensis]